MIAGNILVLSDEHAIRTLMSGAAYGSTDLRATLHLFKNFYQVAFHFRIISPSERLLFIRLALLIIILTTY